MSEPGDPTKPHMPPTPDQANRDVVDFKRFELKDIPFPDGIEIRYDGMSLLIQSQPLDKALERAGGRIPGRIYFDIVPKDRQNTEKVRGVFSIYKSEKMDRFLITMYISRFAAEGRPYKDTRDLPRGIGRVLYRKMIEYLQWISTNRKIKILHRITKEPDYFKISSEDWDRILLPIIREFRYHPINSKESYSGLPEWEHLYEPQE